MFALHEFPRETSIHNFPRKDFVITTRAAGMKLRIDLCFAQGRIQIAAARCRFDERRDILWPIDPTTGCAHIA